MDFSDNICINLNNFTLQSNSSNQIKFNENIDSGILNCLISIGICAACWLLMEQPRPKICISQKLCELANIDNSKLSFYTDTVNGTMSEFL